MKSLALILTAGLTAMLVHLFCGGALKPASTGKAINVASPVSDNISTEFLIAAMDDGTDYDFKYISDTLGLNLWHLYCGTTTDGPNNWHYPDGWTFCAPKDHLFSPIQDYRDDILKELRKIGEHHMQAFIMRPKIEYLCYGQRSDYQCEDTSLIADHDLWFYTFQSPDHTGHDVNDNGVESRFCSTSSDRQGYVVSRLRTNNEQCSMSVWSNAYRNDTEHDWYIKPRIRIPQSFANDPANWSKLVCRIDVYNQDGFVPDTLWKNRIKSFDIRVRNFKPSGYANYDGAYREEFTFMDSINNLWHDTSTQVRRGDWGNKWFWSSRGNRRVDTDNNKADIRVYWYCSCDMWIDYVRVDNDIADKLFKGYYEQPGREWLKWEADIACSAGDVPLKFYIELNEFNNIPAIAYVNHKLDSLCGKRVDMIADQYTFYQYHMSWDDRGKIVKPGQIIKEYVHRIGMTQIYPGCFPFLSVEDRSKTYSRIPNTLPNFETGRILAKAIPPADYDAWLQGDMDTVSNEFQGAGGVSNVSDDDPCAQQPQLAGMYQWVWKLSNQISKEANVPIIGCVQVHQWMVHCGEVDREPTNEELDMTTNIPISYGAKGLIFELYGGYAEKDGSMYWYGLTETDGRTPRYTNVYGQPKWEKFKSIVQRLKTWGPYIMSFDNRQTNSYIYRKAQERNELENSSYFNDVITYKYGQGFQPLCSDNPPLYQGKIYECYDQRYVQVATFKSAADPGSKYFMIVNRRCSPYVNDNSEDSRGGKRFIVLLFHPNHPEFSGHDYWEIVDLGNPSASHIRFDKNSNVPVVLGDYMPGEGKLYKIIPSD